MQRLIIHNVGPVKDADIRLKKVNVFIGPQSSGKSTIAKIISFCSWLEKNKHELEGSFLFAKPVIDKMVGYHRMEGYLQEDSRILYVGDNIAFGYNWPEEMTIPLGWGKDHYNVSHLVEKEVFFFKTERLANPKVLYIPAERNFVSVVPNLQKYDESKDSLQSFIMDWFEAKRSFGKENALDLIDLGMKYYSENDEDYIQMEDGKSIRLRNASSGLQSVTPLLTVADYMTKGMYKKERPFSVEEQDVLNRVLHSLAIESLPTNNMTDLKRRLAGFLQGKVYSHTQFVIEEPEQNLFPVEQYKLMEHLASIINHGKQHRLTISTHSPFILNYLNVLIMRYYKKVEEKVCINPDNLAVFATQDGRLIDMMQINTETGMRSVNSEDLVEAMRDMYTEYMSLRQD